MFGTLMPTGWIVPASSPDRIGAAAGTVPLDPPLSAMFGSSPLSRISCALFMELNVPLR